MIRPIPAVMFMLLILFGAVRASVRADDKSTLEKDSLGWIDLFPNAEMKDWKRVALEVGLVEKHPWSVQGDILLCEGAGAKEMLLYDKPFADGVFHLEWRFRKLDGKQDYNSGAYVRTLDGTVWHQIQIAHLDKPPFMGDLFGDMSVKGKTERVIIPGTGPQHINPPGQCNLYEITCRGKQVDVWMNGHSTLTWNDCAVAKGMVGMQAEFFTIEFRNLKFKPLAQP